MLSEFNNPLEVIFDHFNSYYESRLFILIPFFPSNDSLGGLPHSVIGIIVNFTESPIEKNLNMP